MFDFLDMERIIPAIQLWRIRERVTISPELRPRPRDWWVRSFDWYFVLDLVPDWEYGPFYYGGGDQFWPQIGNTSDESSESNCFYGLNKPRTVTEFNSLYNPRVTNPEYIYQFTIKVSKETYIHNPLLFIGPVKDGEGFQVNPNSITAKLIQLEILAGNVWRYELLSNREDYSSKPVRYIPFNANYLVGLYIDR